MSYILGHQYYHRDHEYSLDLDKINQFKKSTKLPARMLVPRSSRYIPSLYKCVLEILSLKIKTNTFNTYWSLKLSFTCCRRRLNAMLFLGKIDDVIILFTPTLMQDL